MYANTHIESADLKMNLAKFYEIGRTFTNKHWWSMVILTWILWGNGGKSTGNFCDVDINMWKLLEIKLKHMTLNGVVPKKKKNIRLKPWFWVWTHNMEVSCKWLKDSLTNTAREQRTDGISMFRSLCSVLGQANFNELLAHQGLWAIHHQKQALSLSRQQCLFSTHPLMLPAFWLRKIFGLGCGLL